VSDVRFELDELRAEVQRLSKRILAVERALAHNEIYVSAYTQ